MAAPAFIKKLINLTHKHGVSDKKKVAELNKQIKALEKLNERRRKELQAKTSVPVVKGPFTMYDSTQMSQIPRGAKAVAAYINGIYANAGEAAERFPHATLFTISINRKGDADCLDVEHGDAEPSDAAEWANHQKARGVVPIFYANLSTMPEIFDNLVKHGIGRHEVLLWVANPTGVPHIVPGYDATQWDWHGNYDVSLCNPNFRP